MSWTFIPQKKIQKVQELLKQYEPLPVKHSHKKGQLSLRDIGNMVGLSYYTVWCIKEGKHNVKVKAEPPKIARNLFNVDKEVNWLVNDGIKRAI